MIKEYEKSLENYCPQDSDFFEGLSAFGLDEKSQFLVQNYTLTKVKEALAQIETEDGRIKIPIRTHHFTGFSPIFSMWMREIYKKNLYEEEDRRKYFRDLEKKIWENRVKDKDKLYPYDFTGKSNLRDLIPGFEMNLDSE